jgi:regulator of replication initiation timing
MSETRSNAFKETMRPTIARVAVGLPVAAGLYQFGCDQFDWPKLPALWGMTGSQFPWWGWFFVALAGFVYALFEYIRRNVVVGTSSPLLSADADLLRRLEAVEQAAQNKPNLAVLNISNEERFGELDERVRAIETLGQRLDKMDTWKDQISRLITESMQLQTERSHLVEERIAGAEMSLTRSIKKIEASQSLSGDWQRQQVASLYDALGAILHREQLRELGNSIEAGAKELSAPTELGTHLDQERWEGWQTNERAWRATLEQWCDLASCYHRDIKEKVLTLSEDHYLQTGVAEGDQFPQPEAFIAYKAFWGRLKNWRNWRGEADRAVQQVAFNGTAKCRRPIVARNNDDR